MWVAQHRALGGQYRRLHPGQIFHLLGVTLGDVRDVQDQKRSLADPGAPFAQDSTAHVTAQLLAAYGGLADGLRPGLALTSTWLLVLGRHGNDPLLCKRNLVKIERF
jgi:hypothetical protein